MLRTPDEISRARQKIRQEVNSWRAGIAAARRELALDPAKQDEVERRVDYGQAQVALCAQEMKKLFRNGKKQFWPKD